MDEDKRALNFRDAQLLGYDYKLYDYKNVPSEFTGMLAWKIWGKRQALNLSFDADDGGYYLVSAYWQGKPGVKDYSPKSMPDFDLSSRSIQRGMRFRIVTDKTRTGKVKLLEAHPIQ